MVREWYLTKTQTVVIEGTAINLEDGGRVVEAHNNSVRDLVHALENCRLLASRHPEAEFANDIIRFCTQAGVVPNLLRAK